MNKYNKNFGCPKCGNTITKDTYNSGQPSLKDINDIGFPPDSFIPEESIVRTCINCGYSWGEAPLNN